MSKWLKGLALFLFCGIASATTCYLSGGALIMIGGFVACVQPAIPPACPQTSGTLTLRATLTRSTGVSPLLVFLDATTTTDSATLAGANTAFQDVYYSWNFGDTGTSGTSTWAYGANPNQNSRNTATGAIAAHLYVIPDGQGDTLFNPVLTASDGTNTVSCSLSLTTYDASGSNGFPTTATTCISSSGTFTGCPAGANHTTIGTFAAVNANLSGKRLLYRCGESFSGDNATITGTKSSVGAYGGCQNTTTNRPQFTDGNSANPMILLSPNAVDNRISDIDFEGSGGGASNAVWSFVNVLASSVDVSQWTVYNINSTGNKGVYFLGQGNQTGLIASTGVGTSGLTDFINATQNNCANFSTAFQCGQGAGAVYINVNYHAHLGNSITGQGGTGGNIETTRIGACRFCIFSNNFLNSPISAAAALKVTSANTNNSINQWMGQYTEYMEISDNLLGTITASAPTGATPFEVAPENGGVDERIRYVVMERNVISAATNSTNTRLGMFTGQNMTFRDNVCYLVSIGGTNFPQTCNQFGNRGTGTNGGQTPGAGAFLATGLEAYNNSCYYPTTHAGLNCLENDTVGGFTPATASFFKNNLLYVSSGSFTTVVDTGANSVSNNTSTTTNNPSFTNASGTFLVITDWKPTANYTGGTTVPSLYDALGVAWAGTWDLGAVKH